MNEIARFYLAAIRRYGMVRENEIPAYAARALDALCMDELLQKSDTGGVYFMRCKA